MSIILYDIPSTSPGYSVSPNTWRIRYCLNIKGIPYTTEWVELPDIVPLYKKLGVAPTARRFDGSGPHYTLPMIYDYSTSKYIADSLTIADYLERQYPETPQVFPNNTAGLIQAFSDMFQSQIVPALNFFSWNLFVKLNPRSSGYYREVRETTLGKRIEDLILDDQIPTELEKLKGILAKVDALYAKNGGGPYLMGVVPSWADILVASFLVVFRICGGEESETWKEITSWHDRRWGILMESMKRYE